MRAGLLWLIVICTYLSYSQCNTDVTICTAGVAGPFSFTTSAGPPIDYATPVACNTGVNPPNYQFSFISLYITTGGPLNLLIDGDATTGYLDVVVYRIPTGIPPCLAVMDNNNEIGCNYASLAGGCVQFGNDFPCGSSIPAPTVSAGDQLMIIVNNYSGSSSNFTLQLGTGAQTGAPDATIIGPSVTTVLSPPTNFTANSAGGTWTASCGACINPTTGQFNPTTAGVGTHTINYSIGQAPCMSTSSTQITVNNDCSIQNIVITDNGCSFPSQTTDLTGSLDLVDPPNTGSLVATPQCTGVPITIANAPFTASVNFNLNGLPANGSNCDITFSFTDQTNCNATNTVLLPAACPCPAEVGTISSSVIPNIDGNYYVCDGSSIQLSSTGFVAPLDRGGALAQPYSPGLVYAITNCDPGTGNPLNSPCLVGTIVSPATTIDATILTTYPTLTNSELWVTPITVYNTTSLTVDSDCFEAETPMHIVINEPIEVWDSLSCLLPLVPLNATGGFSTREPTQTFTWQVITPGNGNLISSNSIATDTVLLGGLTDGQNFSITVTDAVGCTQTLTDGPFTEPESSSFNYPQLTYCSSDGDPAPQLTGVPGGMYSFPAGLVGNATSGVIDISASTSGSYTVTYTSPDPVCGTSTGVNVNIGGFGVLNSISDISICHQQILNTINPTSTIPGDISWNFTSGTNPWGANSGSDSIQTGFVNNGGSTTISATVEVQLAQFGCLADIEVFQLDLLASDQFSISIPISSTCSTGPDLIPLQTGTSGTYSGTTGLTFNATTGVIDVSASTSAQHTLIYTSNGVCPVTDSLDVEIYAPADYSFNFPTNVCDYMDSISPSIASVNHPSSFQGVTGVDSLTGVIDLTGLALGTYTIIRENREGNCSVDTTTSTFTFQPSPDVNLFSDLDLCHTDLPTNLPLSSSLPNGTAWLYYNASGSADSLQLTGGTQMLSNLDSGIYVFSIIEDQFCTRPLDDTINITSMYPELADFSDRNFCADDDSIQIDFSGNILDGNYGNTWIYNGDYFGLSSVTGTGSFRMNIDPSIRQAQGEFYITSTWNTCIGAIDTVQFQLFNLDSVFFFGGGEYCEGTPAPSLFAGGDTLNGTYNVSYNLSNGTNLNFQTNDTLVIPPNGSSFIEIESISNGGCSLQLDSVIQITEILLPNIVTSFDHEYCSNETFPGLGIQVLPAGANYTWSYSGSTLGLPSSGNDSIPSFNFGERYNDSIVETFIIQPTNSFCAGEPDTVTILVKNVPFVQFDTVTSGICAPVSATYSIITPNTTEYRWSTGNGNTYSNVTSITETYTSPGCYDTEVQASFRNGCSNTARMIDGVCVSPNPTAIFYSTPDRPTGFESLVDLINISDNAASSMWYIDSLGSFDTWDVTTEFPSPGTYNVTLIVTSQDGCIDSSSLPVIIYEDDIIFIPNAFTPNGDNKNDVFTPVIASGVNTSNYEFMVFNKWGDLIFHTTDLNQGWDGRYRGNFVQAGMYIYKMNYQLKDLNEKKELSGHVTIIR